MLKAGLLIVGVWFNALHGFLSAATKYQVHKTGLQNLVKQDYSSEKRRGQQDQE